MWSYSSFLHTVILAGGSTLTYFHHVVPWRYSWGLFGHLTPKSCFWRLTRKRAWYGKELDTEKSLTDTILRPELQHLLHYIKCRVAFTACARILRVQYCGSSWYLLHGFLALLLQDIRVNLELDTGLPPIVRAEEAIGEDAFWQGMAFEKAGRLVGLKIDMLSMLCRILICIYLQNQKPLYSLTKPAQK